MESFHFIAAVKEEDIPAIEEVAKKLEGLGCFVEHIHRFSGIISGKARSGLSIEELKMDEIKYVEPDRTVKTSK